MVGIGVIGAGYWAKNMLRVVDAHPGTQLLHVCDVDEAARSAVARAHPGVHTTADVQEVLTDPDVSGVYVATPPATHADLALQALRADKHVLVEKPLATSADEALQLEETARHRGLTLMVGHTFLFSPPVLKVKEMLAAGQLGEVHYIESQRVNLGKHQASGVLWDLAPHDLSIIDFWLDESPTSVSATGRSFISTPREDVVFLSLEYASGAIAQVHVSWLAPVKLRRTTVSGSQRMAVYDDTAGPEALKIFDYGVDRSAPSTFGEFQLSYRHGDIWVPRLDTTEPLTAEWEHFSACVRDGSDPRASARGGLDVVRTIEAAERSLRSGRREPVLPATGATGARSPQRVSP